MNNELHIQQEHAEKEGCAGEVATLIYITIYDLFLSIYRLISGIIFFFGRTAVHPFQLRIRSPLQDFIEYIIS